MVFDDAQTIESLPIDGPPVLLPLQLPAWATPKISVIEGSAVTVAPDALKRNGQSDPV